MVKKLSLAAASLLALTWLGEAAPAANPLSNFGMTIPDTTIPAPNFPVGSTRDWGAFVSGLPVAYWSTIQTTCTTPRVYDFSRINTWLSSVEPYVSIIDITIIGATPACENGSTGRANPPTDPNSLYLYMTAFMANLTARSATAHIQYRFEIANEIDNTNATTGFCTATCQALLPVYTPVLRGIIKAALPNAIIVGPSLSSSINLNILDTYYAAAGQYIDLPNSHGYATYSTNNYEPEQFPFVDGLYSGFFAHYGFSNFMLNEGGFLSNHVAAAMQPAWTSIYVIDRPGQGIPITWYQYEATPDPTFGNLYAGAVGTQNLASTGIAYRTTESAMLGSTVTSALARVPATNQVTNVTLAGAVAGSPGTDPTGWVFSGCDLSNGLTKTTSLQTINGIPSITYRVFGQLVAGSGGLCRVYYVGSQVATQASSTATFWEACVNYQFTNNLGFQSTVGPLLRLQENNSSGNQTVNQMLNTLPQPNYDLSKPVCFGVPFTSNSATAFMQAGVQIGYPTTINTVVDWSLTMAQAPSLDTSGAWSLSMTRPNGASSVIQWDASGLTPTVAVPAGTTNARDLTTNLAVDISTGSTARTNVPIEYSNQPFNFGF